MYLNMFKTSFGAAKMALKCLFIHILELGIFLPLFCQSHLDKNLNFCFVQNDIECIIVHNILLMRKNLKYIVRNL